MSSLLALVTTRFGGLLQKSSADPTARKRRSRYKDKFWTAIESLEDRTLLSGLTDSPQPPTDPEQQSPISGNESPGQGENPGDIVVDQPFQAGMSPQFGYLDLGDAPESYGTMAPDEWNPNADGARHEALATGPRLGAWIDFEEMNAQPGPLANGDDLDGIDDEDGVSLLTGLEGRDDRDLIRTIRIEAPLGGKLDAWIDFNENGVFDETERIRYQDNRRVVQNESGPPTIESAFEMDGTSLVLHEGVNFVDVVIPRNSVRFTRTVETRGGGTEEVRIESIETYARFRISSAGHLNATGYAADGEVEDYRVTIGNRNPIPGQTPTQNFETALKTATDQFVEAYADELYADPDYVPDGSIPVVFQGNCTNQGGFAEGQTEAVLRQIIAAVNARIAANRGTTENVFVFVAHPVDFVITDPQGRQAGHTEARGTFNEIGDNCTYSGDGAVELLVIRNASAGQYQIDFTGVGGVFRGGASLITASGTQSATFQGGLALSDIVSLALDYTAPAIGGGDGAIAGVEGPRGQAFFNVNTQAEEEDEDDEESSASLAATSVLDAESDVGIPDASRQIKRWIDAVRTNGRAVRQVMLGGLESSWLMGENADSQPLNDEFWTGLGQSMLGGIPEQVFHLGEFLGVAVPKLFVPSEPSDRVEQANESGIGAETHETTAVDAERDDATPGERAGAGSSANGEESDVTGTRPSTSATPPVAGRRGHSSRRRVVLRAPAADARD